MTVPNDSCPAVADVNLTAVDITLPDGVSTRKKEILSPLSGSVRIYKLSAIPISHASVDVYVNGVLQRLTTDYTISGVYVTFTGDVPASAVVQAMFLASVQGVTEDVVLPGTMIVWPDDAGIAIPDGFLECDGSDVLIASYPRLYDVIGTVYGPGDATHFTLPSAPSALTGAIWIIKT